MEEKRIKVLNIGIKSLHYYRKDLFIGRFGSFNGSKNSGDDYYFGWVNFEDDKGPGEFYCMYMELEFVPSEDELLDKAKKVKELIGWL